MPGQSAGPTDDLAGRLGRSVWFDLPAVDLADAMSFYQGLFGWDYRQMENAPEAEYVMIDSGGQLIGGLRKVKSLAPCQNSPILYFTVDALAPKIVRAKELGAQIVGSRVDLGKDRGSYQWIRDRAGNLIGLWAPR